MSKIFIFPSRSSRLCGKTSSFYLILLVLLLLPASTAAQSPITLIHSTAEYRYGQVMRFSLAAASQTPITQVTLAFTTSGLPNTFTVDLTLPPTQAIELTQPVDLTQVRIAPFAAVTFWWLLTDVQGDTFSLPETTIHYADDRFRWQQVEQDGVVVHWAEGEASLAQAALDVTAQARLRLQTIIPAGWPEPLHIYLYPTSSDLRAALRLAGSDWVGGHASPALGVILVAAPDPLTAPAALQRSLPHELTHLLLYQATAAAYETTPIWFKEGLATWFEQNPNPNYETMLRQAVDAGSAIPFAELCLAFPTAEDRALLAYAQSASLVAAIQARYGNHALTEFVDAFADGLRCEAAVQQVLGISLADLTGIWWQSQQQQPLWQRFWLANRLWLLLIGGGFVLIALLQLPLRRPSSPLS